ncbi:MAG: nitroreductase family protein [Prevotella sp.]|nr:nitroreductase family protein [Prevotella sp.]
MEQSVLKNILSRTSVRTFLPRPVEMLQIDTLLRAGIAALSSMDKRPWHFVAVTDAKKLEQLSNANPYAHFASKAPLAIIVCGNLNKAAQGLAQEFWIQDCSAATENILLAAHGMGLGAVWTANYPLQDRMDAVRHVLNLPDYIVPLNTIVIGYPKNEGKPKDKWADTDISWNTFGGKL